MALELIITAKRHVTLRQAMLDYLGVKPGGKICVAFLSDGCIELRRGETKAEIRRLRGALRRAEQKAASLTEMQDAVEAVDQLE